MIEYSKCSNFETKVNGVHIYDDFYCLNLTDKPIVPMYQNKYKMINFNFFICPLDTFIYSTDKCTPIEYFGNNEMAGNIIYFYYYKPILYTQPDNYTNPLKINYEINAVPLYSSFYSFYQAVVEETQIKDDTNWVFNSNKEKLYFQFTDLKSNSNSNNFKEGFFTSPLLTFQIIGSSTSTLITRKYTKLFELLAVLSGFVNVVHFIIGVLCFYINLLSQNFFLFQMTFDTNMNQSSCTTSFSTIKKILRLILLI